ncbi:MAG: hypothetical protein F6K16_37785, partial [Symploca sp. SIO2B6]|nr:hypothetical protein [Symploca sp. SIO2B6]
MGRNPNRRKLPSPLGQPNVDTNGPVPPSSPLQPQKTFQETVVRRDPKGANLGKSKTSNGVQSQLAASNKATFEERLSSQHSHGDRPSEKSPPTKNLSEKPSSSSSPATKRTPIHSTVEEFLPGQPYPQPVPAPPSADETTYDAKTQRIMAWSNLFRAVQPLIWSAVILIVVIPLVG